MPARGDIDYTSVIEIDLAAVEPSVAGPRRPQDRISLRSLPTVFPSMLSQPRESGGFGRPSLKRATGDERRSVDAMTDGDIALAAITSCTNTSNPGLMIGAGLLAKRLSSAA